MNDFDEVNELLIKGNLQGDETYKLINGNEVLSTGSLRQVAHFISNNELFDINANGNSGKFLANNWRYANESEVSTCLREAKYLYGFEEPAN